MKEKTLLEMKKKVDALTNVMHQVFNEIGNLRDLSVGTLETLKLMPGYTEGIEALKLKMEENAKNEAKAKAKAETETETLLEL